MRNVLLLLALLISQSVSAQQLDGRELNEIIQLYFDNQPDIVKAKLENAGFTMMKSTPDYSLNGIKRSGDFSLKYEQTSKDPDMRQAGFMDVSRIFFNTVDYGDHKEYSISFDVQLDNSATTYDYLAYWWSRNTVVKDTCTDSAKCLRLISHVPDKPKGKMKVYDYRISLSNSPLGEGPTRDNLHGMVALRIVPLASMQKTATPTKPKGK